MRWLLDTPDRWTASASRCWCGPRRRRPGEPDRRPAGTRRPSRDAAPAHGDGRGRPYHLPYRAAVGARPLTRVDLTGLDEEARHAAVAREAEAAPDAWTRRPERSCGPSGSTSAATGPAACCSACTT
ncbi:hypothetical protein NKH77_46545 [Streptomyces sp. M19]